jgi:hypothetical protein
MGTLLFTLKKYCELRDSKTAKSEARGGSKMAKYIEMAGAGEKFPLLDAYPYLQERGFYEEVADIRESKDYIEVGSREYTTTDLRRGRIIALLENNNLLTDFIEKYWPYGKTSKGREKMNGYRERLDRFNKRI